MEEEIKNKDLQNKVLNFLDKNSNLILIAILIFAFILRLKYFNINSALWYDEADYLSIAKNWALGVPFEFNPIRPILLPFMAFIFYSFGILSELPLRVINLILVYI